MSTKVIKLQDNIGYTLLPISDANLIQMTVDGETKSVYDVIIENEEVCASVYTDLNARVESLENGNINVNGNSTIDMEVIYSNMTELSLF